MSKPRTDENLTARRILRASSENLSSGLPTHLIILFLITQFIDFKVKGIKQVILSQTEQKWLEKQVEHHNMTNLFNELLGARDIYVKGKVAMALKWIEECDIDAKDVLMVGDTVHDFEVSDSIGCDCVLIARGHHSKGRLMTTTATVIDSIDELRRMVI